MIRCTNAASAGGAVYNELSGRYQASNLLSSRLSYLLFLPRTVAHKRVRAGWSGVVLRRRIWCSHRAQLQRCNLDFS